MIYNSIVFAPESIEVENENEAIRRIVQYASGKFGHKVTESDIRLELETSNRLPDLALITSYKAYGNNNGDEEVLGDLILLTHPHRDMKEVLVEMANRNNRNK